MSVSTSVLSDRQHRARTGRREIGLLGTLARIVGGAVAVSLPIAVGGFGWWDAAAAFVLLPLVALAAASAIAAAFQQVGPSALQSRHAVCTWPACLLVGAMIATNAAFAAVTPANGNVSLWVWLGASMLLAAARGYGGCEVLAIPNLLTRRRDQIGCILYNPLDRWEASRRTTG